MAERRMFSKSVIESDAFLDMPISARLLYYDLGMRGDDDGFVDSPKRIMRLTGASEDDLRLLIAKQFLIPFESGVVVVRHWKVHNLIRNDRYKPTQYQYEKSLITAGNNGVYDLRLTDGLPSDNQMTTNGIPIGCIGKGRLGEESIGKVIESNDSCAEPSADTDAPHRNPNGAVTELPADEAMPKLHECAVIELPLCDGTMHGVYQSSIDRWAELYPAVDIIQQLRAMVGWCEANPSKRKTKRGINKFINGWLAREQDRGGRLEALQGKDFTSTEQYKNLTMD